MEEKELTKLRKLEHIMIAYKKDVEGSNTLFDEITLVHQALPELNMNEIDTTIEFLGKRLDFPLMITGMTGGHPFAGEINKGLAIIAEKHKIAIGVGSQRAALIDSGLSWTYKVVREYATSVPVVANIGAPQLLEKDPVLVAEKAVDMINADALAIHLNAGQEAFQPEGNINYKGVIVAIEKINNELSVPVIVKETGSGISYETGKKLRDIGIKYIDVSGSGGTNWIKVEAYRSLEKQKHVLGKAGFTFKDWGIPTVLSIIETRNACPEAFIIASGGVRTGLDIAKAIVIGANMGGIALPAIRALLDSIGTLDEYINRLKIEFRAAMFLTSSKSVDELKTKPKVLGEKIVNWMNQRKFT